MKRKTAALLLSALVACSLITPVLAEDVELIEELGGEQTEGALPLETEAPVPAAGGDAAAIEIEDMVVISGESIDAQLPGEVQTETADPGTELSADAAAEPTAGEDAEPETGDGVESVLLQTGTEIVAAETSAVAEEHYFAGNSIAEATEVQIGGSCAGTLSGTNPEDYYRFSVGSSGCVRLRVNAAIKTLNCNLYDASGKKIWKLQKSWNKVTGQLAADETLDLTQGTYYLSAVAAKDEKGQVIAGTYTFALSFTGAGESFAESGSGTNNSKETASEIALGTGYNGQIALNDTKDFYRFHLDTSGKVHVASSARMEGITYRIYYDTENSARWGVKAGWDSTLGQLNVSEDVDLIAGTYYFVANKNGCTGNYSFSLSFTSANESFAELQLWANNTIDTANDILLGTTYAGQIAENDGKDFYRFTVDTAGLVMLQATAEAQGINYLIYDQAGTKLWSTKQKRSEGTDRIVTAESVELGPGTYYFTAARQEDYTGNYSFQLSMHVHSFVQEVTKATLTEDGVITERCECGETGSTETICHPAVIALSSEEYTYNGKTKKPEVIVTGSDGLSIDPSNYTVTYASGRKKVGKYAVKVKFRGNYSGSKTLKFVIVPKGTSISKLTAASGGFTVKVKEKTTQTTGYQIQYATNKKFTGTVKSTYLKNTKTSVTYRKLKAGKKYYVRVRTYKTVNGKKYYSDWSAVKAVTTRK